MKNDEESLNMLERRMGDVLPKNYKPMEYIITPLIQNKKIQKEDSEGKEIVDSLNSCLLNLYNTLIETDENNINITSWFSRRKNVFGDRNVDLNDVKFTDFELLYGTSKEDVWDMKVEEELPLKGILNYSYAENKYGFKQDQSNDLIYWKLILKEKQTELKEKGSNLSEEEKNEKNNEINEIKETIGILKKGNRLGMRAIDAKSKEDRAGEDYLFTNLEDIADWVKKDGQENLFYSRNYVEQIKTLLKDFLFLAKATTTTYDQFVEREFMTNNQSFLKRQLKT